MIMKKVTITTIDTVCPFCGTPSAEKLQETLAVECCKCHARARLDCLSRVGNPEIQFIKILWQVPADQQIGVL